MINYIYIILIIIIFLILIINIYLYKYYKDIKSINDKLLILFNDRFGVIPGFFEISKGEIVKHSKIFYEALEILKLFSTTNNFDMNFFRSRYIMSKLDHEIEFLFKVFNKNSTFKNNYKFRYLKDITINNNIEIGNNLKYYDNFLKKYNTLVKINNIFLIGYFLPSNKLKY